MGGTKLRKYERSADGERWEGQRLVDMRGIVPRRVIDKRLRRGKVVGPYDGYYYRICKAWTSVAPSTRGVDAFIVRPIPEGSSIERKQALSSLIQAQGRVHVARSCLQESRSLDMACFITLKDAVDELLGVIGFLEERCDSAGQEGM